MERKGERERTREGGEDVVRPWAGKIRRRSSQVGLCKGINKNDQEIE